MPQGPSSVLRGPDLDGPEYFLSHFLEQMIPSNLTDLHLQCDQSLILHANFQYFRGESVCLMHLAIVI